MKFIKLTIHNIASIEDAEINFEEGPLAEDSCFLITGPTGAGKTTILDAICLALFNKTPRLAGSSTEVYHDSVFEGEDSDTTTAISDSRMLMRRGSVEAKVVLVFTDNEGKKIRAEWSCKHAYKKIEGRLQSVDWVLKDNETSEVLYTRRTEVEDYIRNLLGMNFDEFCRTTMLAQGEFTKFLKSTTKDKSEILEKLTGTDIYSKIGAEIYRLKREKEGIKLGLEEKLKGIMLLTEDELAKVKQEIDSKEQEGRNLEIKIDNLNTTISWLKNVQDTKKKIEENRLELSGIQKIKDSDKYKSDENALSDWNQTTDQRSLLMQINELRKEWENYVEKEEDFKETYNNLCEGLIFQENELKVKEQQFEIKKQFVESHKGEENLYSQIPAIKNDIDYVKNYTNINTTLKDDISSYKNEKLSLSNTSNEKHNEKAKIENEKEDLNNKLEECRKQIQALEATNPLGMSNQIQVEIEKIKKYKSEVSSCDSANVECSELNKQLAEARKLMDEDKEKEATLEVNIKELEANLKSQEAIYDTQKLACKDIIKEYRHKLKIGDKCPLCGQEIKQIISDETFQSVLDPIREKIVSLTQERESLRGKLSDVKSKIFSLQREINTDKSLLSESQKKLEEYTKKLQENPLYLKYKDVDLLNIDNEIENLNANSKIWDEKVSQLVTLQKDANSLNSKLMDCQGRLTNITNDINEYVLRDKELDSKINNAKLRIDENSNQIEDLLARLKDICGENVCLLDSDKYLLKLKEEARQYEEARQNIQQLELEISASKMQIQDMKVSKERAEAIHPSWFVELGAVCESGVDYKGNLKGDWSDFLMNFQSNYREKERCSMSIKEKEHSLKTFYSNNTSITLDRLSFLNSLLIEDINFIKTEHENIKGREKDFRAIIDEAEKRLKKLKDEPPKNYNEENLELLEDEINKTKGCLKELNQDIGSKKNSLERNNKDKETYKSIADDLEHAKKELDGWERLCKLFGDANGTCFRGIAQSYVLERLLKKANGYLKQFTDRYEMVCQTGSLTILLRDMDAGGVLRPTTTVSGGESFLLSLSLALGLASLNYNTGSIDMIFIDEGFGTLDSTYLSTVLDALAKLHQILKKRIGIISHVEALKERITTQVQVTRVNSITSKINVVSLL